MKVVRMFVPLPNPAHMHVQRFTICLFVCPDLDGHRAPKMKKH